VSVVRALWNAANNRDPDGIVAQTSDDVVWLPYTGRKPEYHGHAGVREFYFEQYAAIETINVTEYAFREFGDVIVFTGALHTVDAHGGVAQRQLHYLFWVRDGKIHRAQSFARRQDAIAAAEAAAGRPG
jgi:ketosteroid isomerase-like protein